MAYYTLNVVFLKEFKTGAGMKYVFIINPNSGRKSKRERFCREICDTAERLGIDYELYFTKGPKDCGRYARELCMKSTAGGEKLRIYGCGGDGMVNELVNGVFGAENVEIGVIPMGTGNDYIRNYGAVKDFLDLESQMTGIARSSDLIKYWAQYDDIVTEGYCANMFNIGFDCNVVDLTQQLKRIPLLNGPLVYIVGVAVILIKKKGADLLIESENKVLNDGELLLTSIANGCYCGGGVKGSPLAKLDDGLMDVTVIGNVTRRFFVSMFPSYKKGTHLEKSKVIKGDVIRCTKERSLTITARGESLKLCVDGEISVQKKVEFSMVKDAVRFIVPRYLCV